MSSANLCQVLVPRALQVVPPDRELVLVRLGRLAQLLSLGLSRRSRGLDVRFRSALDFSRAAAACSSASLPRAASSVNLPDRAVSWSDRAMSISFEERWSRIWKATLTPGSPLRNRNSPSSCLALFLQPGHIGSSAIPEDRRGTSAGATVRHACLMNRHGACVAAVRPELGAAARLMRGGQGQRRDRRPGGSPVLALVCEPRS